MAKSVMELAFERIDKQINDLNRAKSLIRDAVGSEDEPAPKPKRGRKRKGLPAPDATAD